MEDLLLQPKLVYISKFFFIKNIFKSYFGLSISYVSTLSFVAEVYAIHFASQGIEQSYNSLLKELKEGNMQNLNDCHANSAGLKAFCSWAVRDGIRICRDCCEGLGYSAYNRLARLIIDFAVQTTWDGDNVILAQQTARYLLSSLAKVSQGKNLQGSVKYLESSKLLLSSKFFCDSEESLMDFNQLLQALQYRTANLCHYIALRLQEEISQGKSSEEAWDECCKIKTLG